MFGQVMADNGEMHKARIAQKLARGIENYFRYYAFDEERGIFNQGGFFIDGVFVPTQIFAVDCQTWAVSVLGPAWVDEVFGEGTAYRIWKKTKSLSGFYSVDGDLMGVGFTEARRVLAVEWTGGAILMTRMMADHYRQTHPDWARELAADAIMMRHGIEELTVRLENGSLAYLYANDKYFIPFGWWANRIPSTVASSWVIMNDHDFNPFVLGGGDPIPYADILKAKAGEMDRE
jgi:hypothetical protein